MEDNLTKRAVLVGRRDFVEVEPLRPAVRTQYLDRITHQAGEQFDPHALKHEKRKHVLGDRGQDALGEFLARRWERC